MGGSLPPPPRKAIMAQFSTTPVFKCKRCGRPLLLIMGGSFNDPEGKMLPIIAKAVEDNALCVECSAKKAWYIRQGRIADWEAGRP